MEDRELAERARRGDVGAYEELVRRYQQVAFRAAYLLTGDAAEAEDAVQEAFVKAYRAMGRFRPGAPFRPWLLAITTNEARNRGRAAGRRANLAVRAAAESQPGETSDEVVLARERREMLMEAVGGMSEEDRVIIAHRYFLDLSEKETAEALGLRRGTVKSRLSRALARLRTRMDPKGASDA